MDPNFWGPSCWNFLHTITLDPRCKENDECKVQKRLLTLLKQLLPCQKCRRSYQDFVKTTLHKCELKDIGSFLCNLHQQVNKKLNKPAAVLRSQEDWKKFYTNECSINGWNMYLDDMFYFLFVLVFNYPQDWAYSSHLSKSYLEFFTLLPQAIPSEKCKNCLEVQMKLRPLTPEILRARQPLILWLYEIYKVCLPTNQQNSLEKITEVMESIRL